MSEYTKLGHKPQKHHAKDIWELDLSDFKAVNPIDYFRTSGEAVEKAKQLEKDAWKLAGQVRRFRHLLEKTRGKAVYLEVSWHEGMLLAKAKNPRKRKPKSGTKNKHKK